MGTVCFSNGHCMGTAWALYGHRMGTAIYAGLCESREKQTTEVSSWPSDVAVLMSAPLGLALVRKLKLDAEGSLVAIIVAASRKREAQQTSN